jgi:hypothetical protein
MPQEGDGKDATFRKAMNPRKKFAEATIVLPALQLSPNCPNELPQPLQ